MTRHRLRGLFALLLAIPALAWALEGDLLDGLSARNIGPAAVGGRIAAIDVVASDPQRIYIGAATGGVWASSNGGLNWEPIFDDEAVASIGALAINQSNPDIIWVGTGESNVRNSTSIGAGIYKSVDGGQNWQRMGLERTERIDRIALHPTNPDIVYVAALGHLWGENPERGIYRTADGGQSWKQILYVDETTGGTDVKLDPFNPDRVYAAMWQFRRWPWHFRSGGPGSGMYVSSDGGETWQQRTEEDGLPKSPHGRMVIAPSAAQPGLVYALVEAEDSALVRSTDGGRHWTKVNEDYNIANRPFYYSELYADPQHPDRVYNVYTRVGVSNDGGASFKEFAAIDCCRPSNTIHIDNHAFWINPHNPDHLIDGNDGGLAISHDGGDTWRFVRNLPLAQFYHVRVDDAQPYNVYGGLQDNGSWMGPAEIREAGGIRNLHWQEVGFGDGFDTIPDPEIERQGYAMSQGGYLVRWNLDSGEQRFIRPDPPSPDVTLRFNWNAGFAQDPFDPATIYYGSQFLHKSTDRGETWTVVSPDLTSNNPQWQTYTSSGGITPDVTAAENYTTIVAVAPSPVEQGVIWVGTDDGRVHVTRDGGESWERIDGRMRGPRENAWVPMIDASPHDAGTAFVVVDDHRRDDMTPYVYRVEGYGRDWRRLESEVLAGYALSVRQDHVDPNLLFVGTELGLFFSTDGGRSFSRFTAGLPTVSVMDIAIQQREDDLVLGTHGRGIYVIDDYGALRGLSDAGMNQRLSILDVTPGQQYDANPIRSSRFTGSGEFRADNEPYGVMVTFVAAGRDLPHPDETADRERRIARRLEAAAQVLEEDVGAEEEGTEREEDDDTDAPADEEQERKDEDEPKVEVKVATADGDVIRTFRAPLQQGLNRVVWSMTRDGVRPMPGPEPAELEDGLPEGLEVPPGEYQLTLSFDGMEQTRTVEVLADPRSPYGVDAQRENYEAQLALQRMIETTVTAVERIVHARDDIDTLVALIDQRASGDDSEAMKELKRRAQRVSKGLTELEERFRVPPKTTGIVYDDDKVISRIYSAAGYVDSTKAAPTRTYETWRRIAEASLRDAVYDLNAYLEDEVTPLRAAVTDAGIGLLQADPIDLE